jgi:hypothetical protein
MKTAIYIENGLTQLVLTPETDFEKGIIGKIEKGAQKVNIYTGSFYNCQGGWTRHGRETDSLILKMSINADHD